MHRGEYGTVVAVWCGGAPRVVPTDRPPADAGGARGAGGGAGAECGARGGAAALTLILTLTLTLNPNPNPNPNPNQAELKQEQEQSGVLRGNLVSLEARVAEADPNP